MERMYQMIRVEKGDYLLPSNDRQTLWRIRNYLEDGSLERGNDSGGWDVVRGMFWGVSRYNNGSPERAFTDEDLLEWSQWDHWSGPHRTRQEAINEIVSTTIRP